MILSLDEETKIEMEENMNAWKEKRTGLDAHKHSDEQKGHAPAALLGPGEWDEGLGFPLSVVCIQSEKIEKLEREHAWQEDHFDFLLQWLRTVLLKHGASLCYVANYDSNHVRTLLHASLNIQSLLKKEVAKHNVIDRDKILVPPNWDSWGKIRILRDAFEAEAISERWSIEIAAQPAQILDYKKLEEPDSAVAMFESNIPKPPASQTSSKEEPKITITVPSLQEFLQEQKAELERIAAKDEEYALAHRDPAGLPGTRQAAERNPPRVEHPGSYQINVNGIDVDAEEATRRLREREEERKTKRDTTPSRKEKTPAEAISTEQYKNFFADLMIKKAAGGRGSTPGSGVASPRRESPARTNTSDHT